MPYDKMNPIKRWKEKREFFKKTIERIQKYYGYDLKHSKEIARRNWKIKLTRMKQEAKKRGV